MSSKKSGLLAIGWRTTVLSYKQISRRQRNPIPTTNMGLWQKWNSLPVKARYYIGGSTMLFAVIGDYVTGQINEEVVNRKKIVNEMENSASK